MINLFKINQLENISIKGNNKITERRAIFQRERQNSSVNKQTKSVNNRKTGKTTMALTQPTISLEMPVPSQCHCGFPT